MSEFLFELLFEVVLMVFETAWDSAKNRSNG